MKTPYQQYLEDTEAVFGMTPENKKILDDFYEKLRFSDEGCDYNKRLRNSLEQLIKIKDIQWQQELKNKLKDDRLYEKEDIIKILNNIR